MTDMLTPNDVVKQLSQLGRDLDAIVRTLKEAELDAVVKRHDADIAESKAFVNAEGSVDLRKHLARLATEKVEGEALVSEAVVRHLRARIKAVDARIEIGRSMGVALRSELKMLPYSESA